MLAAERASTIELAALLMDAICRPAEREQTALRELTSALGVELGRVQSELTFLRAYATDLAFATTLADEPTRADLRNRLYQHWQRLEGDVGMGLSEDLRDHLVLYGQAASGQSKGSGRLRDAVGSAFARCCADGDINADLAYLGGAMFAAFYDEVCRLLEAVDLVQPSGDDIEESTYGTG